MKHLLEQFTAMNSHDQELYRRIVDFQQEEILKSQSFPYMQVAYFLALLYCLTLIFVAILIKIFLRLEKRQIDQRLAEIYYYVPEMVIHKSVELNAYIGHQYTGKGLDLGCGNGYVGGILISAMHLSDLIGIDLFETNRDLALENGYSQFYQGDIQQLPFDNNAFNYVISICVIEHIPNLTKVLAEAYRVLAHQGKLFFSTPSPVFRESTLGYRFFKLLGMNKYAEGYKKYKDVHSMQFHYLSQEDWRLKLEEVGFTDVCVEPIFNKEQLLAYDIINFQVHWLRFYFSDKIYSFLTRFPRFKKMMVFAAETISEYVSYRKTTAQNATHYFISCSKK